MEEKQSAYRKFHSTETALLKVKTDIIKAMDNQEITCLILLDLLAAFDTVDHTILLDRLETTFGIKDTAMEWITSFLIGKLSKLQLVILALILEWHLILWLWPVVYHRGVSWAQFYLPYTLCHLEKFAANTIYPTTCMQMTPNYT